MKLIILGAGGYGKVIHDLALRSNRYSEIYYLDDNCTDERVIGKCADFEKYIADDTDFYPAFGDNEYRLAWLDRFDSANAKVLTLIDETAYVAPSAMIEKNTIVLPKAIVNSDSTVKRGCIINCGSIVDHDCIIEEGVHISIGAIIKSENRVPRLMKVEEGTVINNRFYSLEEDKK